MQNEFGAPLAFASGVVKLVTPLGKVVPAAAVLLLVSGAASNFKC
jgi:hypothetical protein